MESRHNPSTDTKMVQINNPKVTTAPPPIVTHPGCGPQPAPAMIKIAPLVGPRQTRLDCPFCQTPVITTTECTATTRTHRIAFLCACFNCCCLPYCMESTRNVDHFCPNCKKYLGTYEK